MAKKHVMTAKRRAALRKAQLVSARKRRRANNPHSKKTIRRAERRAQWGKYGHKRKRAINRTVKVAKTTGQVALVSSLVIGPVATYKLGTLPVRAGYHGSKGFAKGFKQGYQGRRMNQQRAAYNRSQHVFGRATAHRVPQRALPQHATRQTRSQRRRH